MIKTDAGGQTRQAVDAQARQTQAVADDRTIFVVGIGCLPSPATLDDLGRLFTALGHASQPGMRPHRLLSSPIGQGRAQLPELLFERLELSSDLKRIVAKRKKQVTRLRLAEVWIQSGQPA